MYEFFYDNVKRQSMEKKEGKLCYIDTYSFTIYIKNRGNL